MTKAPGIKSGPKRQNKRVIIPVEQSYLLQVTQRNTEVTNYIVEIKSVSKTPKKAKIMGQKNPKNQK
jgi:hypothetical protein